MSEAPSTKELLALMDGYEIRSIHYEAVVGVRGREVINAGEVIDVLDTDEKVKALFHELFVDEFGTDDVASVLEEEFGRFDRDKDPKREDRAIARRNQMELRKEHLASFEKSIEQFVGDTIYTFGDKAAEEVESAIRRVLDLDDSEGV